MNGEGLAPEIRPSPNNNSRHHQGAHIFYRDRRLFHHIHRADGEAETAAVAPDAGAFVIEVDAEVEGPVGAVRRALGRGHCPEKSANRAELEFVSVHTAGVGQEDAVTVL